MLSTTPSSRNLEHDTQLPDHRTEQALSRWQSEETCNFENLYSGDKICQYKPPIFDVFTVHQLLHIKSNECTLYIQYQYYSSAEHSYKHWITCSKFPPTSITTRNYGLKVADNDHSPWCPLWSAWLSNSRQDCWKSLCALYESEPHITYLYQHLTVTNGKEGMVSPTTNQSKCWLKHSTWNKSSQSLCTWGRVPFNIHNFTAKEIWLWMAENVRWQK